MKQFYCLMLIVLACGIEKIHCNRGVVRDEWEDVAEEFDVLRATANNLLNISWVQVDRTTIFLTQIREEVVTITKDEIGIKTDLALLEINEWKELTISFGLEPPTECVTDQESALEDMSIEYMSIIGACCKSIMNEPIGEINSILLSINIQTSTIENLYYKFHACGQDATCLSLLYPQISEIGQYNTEIRDQIFSIEKVVSDFQENIETQCAKPTLESTKQSTSSILKGSKECLQNAITALGN